jgi:uncharacterized lipoprotein YajG
MRFVRTVVLALLVVASLATLAGCGAPPVTFAAIPIHPNLSSAGPAAASPASRA